MIVSPALSAADWRKTNMKFNFSVVFVVVVVVIFIQSIWYICPPLLVPLLLSLAFAPQDFVFVCFNSFIPRIIILRLFVFSICCYSYTTHPSVSISLPCYGRQNDECQTKKKVCVCDKNNIQRTLNPSRTAPRTLSAWISHVANYILNINRNIFGCVSRLRNLQGQQANERISKWQTINPKTKNSLAGWLNCDLCFYNARSIHGCRRPRRICDGRL